MSNSKDFNIKIISFKSENISKPVLNTDCLQFLNKNLLVSANLHFFKSFTSHQWDIMTASLKVAGSNTDKSSAITVRGLTQLSLFLL